MENLRLHVANAEQLFRGQQREHFCSDSHIFRFGQPETAGRGASSAGSADTGAAGAAADRAKREGRGWPG